MCCALAGDSDAVAALLQSVCEITLSETREVEAAVAFDWTERLHDEALAGRLHDAHGTGAARVGRLLSPANARPAVDERENTHVPRRWRGH
jgi:hypothetical protein